MISIWTLTYALPKRVAVHFIIVIIPDILGSTYLEAALRRLVPAFITSKLSYDNS